MLTVERLRAVLNYDPATGVFTRKVSVGAGKAGKVPGCVGNHGYRQIQIDGEIHLAHRLAWLYVHGAWPAAAELDHINHDPLDNRIGNLREATHAQNLRNVRRHRDNRSGLKGVAFHRQSGKYLARITIDGKSVSLGLFVAPEEAHAAYCRAASDLHQDFARFE